MASFVFLKAKAKFAAAELDWADDVLRIMPVDTVPDPDTDEFVDDLSADEIGSVRETLASAAINEDAANDQVELDAEDSSLTAVTAGSTMVGVVVYKQVGGDDSTEGNDPVLVFLDTDDIATNGGDIDLTYDAEGLIKF